MYRGLNKLQYVDGQRVVNISRDDAAGYRLDTLTTNKQYATPVVQGKDVVTTRTDYVNRYPSIIQTTSYNFSSSATTPEMCAGVVKAPKIREKNPTQHFVDLEMLEEEAVFRPVFFDLRTGLRKPVDSVRVDGASDEGPAHDAGPVEPLRLPRPWPEPVSYTHLTLPTIYSV